MATESRSLTPVMPAVPGDAGRSVPDGFDGPRACGPYDLASTLDLLNLVFRTQPATGSPRAPTMGWDYSHVYQPDNLENVRIICHQGRPVSSVGIYPTSVRTARGTLAVGGINAVATHPDYRRLGLGTRTLEDAHATMRAAGLHVGLLSTGISNYYRKLGWERAGEQRTFTFDRRNVTYLPDAADLEVSENWRAHLGNLCALHNAGDMGATRTEPTFARLVERKANRVFIARRRDTAVAYAALSGASVREYGGAAEDVAALLRSLFPAVENLPARSTDRTGRQAGQFEMTVVTPASATGLPALLLALGVPSARTYLGMLVILDAPRLFEALGIEVAIERQGEGWRLRHGGQALDVTEGELAKIAFGPERRPGFAPQVFPIEFYQWPLDRV
ncbi:MAG: GNAT family N-acetyltransferase [Chloroflexota bacterium]